MGMEEEQKPKDLFEKKIKEEIDDFSQEVKEEPLLLAESVYFPQITPQNISEGRITSFSPQYISEVNDFVTEVSHEGLFSHQFEVKQEALLEKVKKEPLDEDDFTRNVPYFREVVDPWLQSNSSFFDMPNEEISNNSSQIIKQAPVCSEPRSVVAMDDVKKESIDEFVDDLNSQMHLNHTIMEKPNQKDVNRRCSICSQLKPLKFFKRVESVHDKLIIMIKLVLCGEYNLSDAQSFVYQKKRVPICHSHFSEALNEICSVLRIQKLIEIWSCSSELMQNLMRTVNAFYPQLAALDFCDILNNFTSRNHHSLRMANEIPSRIEQVNEPSTQFLPHLYLNNTQPIQKISNDESSSSSSQNLILFNSESINGLVEVGDVKLESIDVVDEDEEENDDIDSEMKTWENNEKSHNTITNRDSKKFNVRCSVCFELKIRKLWKNVWLVYDKLIIMIKLVLCDEWTLAKAKLFMSKKKRVPICHVHFSEAINEIYSVLCIEKRDEVHLCSSELMNNLMVTVNAFRPRLSAIDFVDILNNFTKRNKHIHQMQISEIQLEKQESQNFISNESKNCSKTESSKVRCSVCSQMKLPNELRTITSVGSKLIITIGCVLRGEHTIETAQSSFMSNKMSVCHAHISEALNEVCSVLRIKEHEDIYSCPSELIQHLMATVHTFCPQLTTFDFRKILCDFIRRNQNSLRMVHLETKQENQNLLNLISDENKNRSETGTSKTENHRCSVCARMKPSNELRGVKSEEYKMMCMIGCILRGEYTIREAHSFLYRAKARFVCQIHFSQAIEEIYNALSIKHYDEFAFCSVDKMNNLMIIVNDLIPKFETWQFHNSLEKFVNSQKRLI